MIASIEAPFTLFEEPVKVVLFNTIEFSHVSLRLVPEILDAVDVVLFIGKQFGVIDPMMSKVTDIQRVVRSERVGVNNAIGLNLFLDNGQNRLRLCIRNDSGIDLATPF